MVTYIEQTPMEVNILMTHLHIIIKKQTFKDLYF